MKALLAVAAALILTTATTRADEPVEGTISETGWGSFKLVDKDKATRRFNESKAETKYDPADWRPAVGDEVIVTYTALEKKLRVDQLKLVKAGPDTVLIKSPVEVEISDVGRTGFKCKIPAQASREVKFTRSKEMDLVPVGWVPTAGEKARVEFTTKPAATNFGLNHEITKMTRITAFSPSPATEPEGDKAK